MPQLCQEEEIKQLQCSQMWMILVSAPGASTCEESGGSFRLLVKLKLLGGVERANSPIVEDLIS